MGTLPNNIKRKIRSLALICLVAALVVPACSKANAADSRDAALIVDGVTGRILYERNAEAPRYPASLTKMMTLYLLFDAIEKKRVGLDTQITASRYAAAQTPTKLGVAAGQSVSIDTAIRALAVRSANDVAVMVAETLGGTEQDFAAMMTAAARSLGMENTTFRNASGLPDNGQTTTAKDMALLGRRLAYDFPQHYHYLSLDEFHYNGRRYRGHNNVTREYDGADGIKTGYIRRSGFNLVTSAFRDNTHLIGVVLGGRTAHERDSEMMRLLSESFAKASVDPTLTAHANVPWRDGPGRKTFAFYRRPDVISMLPAQVIRPRNKPGASVYARIVNDNEGFGVARLSPSLSDAFRSLTSATPTAESAVAPSADVATCGQNANPCLSLAEWPSASLVDDGEAQDLTVEFRRDEGDDSEAALDPLWVVHLGIFPNEDLARSQLDHTLIINTLNSPEKIIEPFAADGGQQYYRAHLGYFEESEARSVCGALSDRGVSCTPRERSF